MFFLGIVLGLLFIVEAVVRNETCPVVTPRELDWKELDGTWYISAIATDLEVQGECAMIIFDHQDTLGVSILWISNNTVTYYNGSVALTSDPNSNITGGDLLMVTYNDNRTETYSFLDINYEHYAVIFACYDNDDGNSSTYEIWKLTRTPHLKDVDAAKFDQAIANYTLQDTPFTTFNNTEDTCKVNGGSQPDASALIMASAAAITLLRRMY